MVYAEPARAQPNVAIPHRLSLVAAFLPMALCTNGSEPNPSAPLYVWVSWLDAKAWLGAVWGVLGWIGIATHATLHEVATFCASEPTQPVTPSDATLLAAFRDPVAFEDVLTYIEQSALWWVWAQTCQCVAAAAGTCAERFPDSYTNTAVGPGGSGFEIGERFTVSQAGLSFYGWRVWHAQAINTNVGYTLWDNTTSLSVAGLTVGGNTAGYHRFLLSVPFALVNGRTYTVSYGLPTGYQWFSDATFPAPPTNALVTYGNPYNAAIGTFPNTAGGGVTAIDAVVCQSPGPDPQPTDPADPAQPATDLPDIPILTCSGNDVCQLIQQLQASVTHNRTMIDLIQRQAVPFGYIVGTVHSGLSGSGSLTVQGTLGLLAQLATVPGVWGRSADNPQRYIPAPLNLTVATSDGDQDTHWVHFAEELWFPPAAGAMTTIHYKFAPGCNGAITELLREP